MVDNYAYVCLIRDFCSFKSFKVNCLLVATVDSFWESLWTPKSEDGCPGPLANPPSPGMQNLWVWRAKCMFPRPLLSEYFGMFIDSTVPWSNHRLTKSVFLRYSSSIYTLAPSLLLAHALLLKSRIEAFMLLR